MTINIGAGLRTAASPSIPIILGSGQAWPIPSGDWSIWPGRYTFFQTYDPITALWRQLASPFGSDVQNISSDGWNYRLANLTGCVVGASVTNAGTGYTNGIYYSAGFPIPGNSSALVQLGTAAQPSVTFAAGGGTVVAQGNVIVGGAINTTVTITAGGTNYTYPPQLLVSNPPNGGVPATMYCTISGGAINAVTVLDQGAGYPVAPTVTVLRHPLDTTGAGGVLTVNATLVGSGTVTAVTVPINGVGMNAVPAITFLPASTTAATAIMCMTVTTGNAQTSASNMGTGNVGLILGALVPAASSVLLNPTIQTNLFVPRLGFTAFNTTAGGGVTAIDGGLHQAIPAGIAYAVLSSGTISAAATAVPPTMGGVVDTSFVTQA
jgi:hypothetical protein